jgi:hypothetical protein
MAEITRFHGILPPRSQRRALFADGVEGLIGQALAPLQGELEAALMRCDHSSALQLAYGALRRIGDGLAVMRGDTLLPGQVRIHALLVELMPLPMEAQFDGTLMELGTQIAICYRNCAVGRDEATALGQCLAEQHPSQWLRAWAAASS